MISDASSRRGTQLRTLRTLRAREPASLGGEPRGARQPGSFAVLGSSGEKRRKHPGRDAMATSSCRVHAPLSWRARARALPFIYITRLLTRAQLAFSRDPSVRVSAPDRWRRLDAKKYINRVNICRVTFHRVTRDTHDLSNRNGKHV